MHHKLRDVLILRYKKPDDVRLFVCLKQGALQTFCIKKAKTRMGELYELMKVLCEEENLLTNYERKVTILEVSES